VGPALIILFIFYKTDYLKPEPTGLITKVFFLGAGFTLLLAVLLSYIPQGSNFTTNKIVIIIIDAFIIAGLIEETFKFILFKILIYKNKHFDEIMDGILYMATISLAFAAVENFGYGMMAMSGGFEYGITVIILRAVSAVPMHATMSGIMGYYIAREKILHETGSSFKGLVIAVLIHGFYNFFAFISEIIPEGSPIAILSLGSFGVLGLSIAFLVKLIRKARDIDSERLRTGQTDIYKNY
jgi:RsiW-degrading membrane proteinase PrsW (M82 family)